MSKALLAAGLAVAAIMVAAPASAAVLASFGPGDASPGPGFTVINTFDNDTGIVGTGAGFVLQTAPANTDGAPPANSVPFGTSYLSVLGNGTATINFAAPVSRFEFDWGSVDDYNTLDVTLSGGGTYHITGSGIAPPADGNQGASATNGLFQLRGDAGETFTSITLSSSSNSFEIDNLAVGGVPEPATWAMMITGFAGMGAMIRRRRSIGAIA
jgi:hypothetical protein